MTYINIFHALCYENIETKLQIMWKGAFSNFQSVRILIAFECAHLSRLCVQLIQILVRGKFGCVKQSTCSKLSTGKGIEHREGERKNEIKKEKKHIPTSEKFQCFIETSKEEYNLKLKPAYGRKRVFISCFLISTLIIMKYFIEALF